MNAQSAHSTQPGFSLVELMVAIAVSLLLMLAIVTVFLGNKDSYRTQNALAALHQEARLARFVLKNAIAHAGYRVDIDPDPVRTFNQGFIADDPDASLTHAAGSDSLTVRFQSDGVMNNCAGGRVPANETAHFHLYLDGDNRLTCTIYDENGQPTSTHALIDNVVQMKLRFGLDSEPRDDRAGVDSYADAIDAGNRDAVRLVRAQLVLRSEQKISAAPPQAFVIAPASPFQPVAQNATAPYYAYLMVDQVIALRNLLP